MRKKRGKINTYVNYSLNKQKQKKLIIIIITIRQTNCELWQRAFDKDAFSRRYNVISIIERDVRPVLLKTYSLPSRFPIFYHIFTPILLLHFFSSFLWFAPYMDSPPSRSPGRNEFIEEGVARCGSGVSKLGWGAPHNADGHSWLVLVVVLHVSDVACREPALAELCIGLFWLLAPPPFLDQLLLPDVLCWLSCCSKVCTSFSAGDSANMVVLPSTQLFSAPCAYVIQITNTRLR